VDLLTSTFYQKREQPGTAHLAEKRGSLPEENSFTRTYSVVKELTV
jgi:hypothetical protein